MLSNNISKGISSPNDYIIKRMVSLGFGVFSLFFFKVILSSPSAVTPCFLYITSYIFLVAKLTILLSETGGLINLMFCWYNCFVRLFFSAFTTVFESNINILVTLHCLQLLCNLLLTSELPGARSYFCEFHFFVGILQILENFLKLINLAVSKTCKNFVIFQKSA